MKFIRLAYLLPILLMACPVPPPLQYTFGPSPVDFGTEASEVHANAWSNTDSAITFTLSTETPWITAIAPAQATSTGPNDPVSFLIEASRRDLEPGEHQGALTLEANGTTESIDVFITVPAEDDLEARLFSVLEGEIRDFELAEIDVQLAMAEAEQSGLVSLPAVMRDGAFALVDIAAERVFLRNVGLTHGGVRRGAPANAEVEEVPLPEEMHFILGQCQQMIRMGVEPNPGCGTMSVMDEDKTMMRAMVMHPEVGASYIQPVNLLLRTRDYPNLHIVYHSSQVPEIIFPDEEEPPLPPREGEAEPRKKLVNNDTIPEYSTSIVLDGDVEFYERGPETVWSRQESAFFIANLIFSLMEPVIGGNFRLDLTIKGQEVWASGGPQTNDADELLDMISDPDYFLLNPVEEDELLHMFTGRLKQSPWGGALGAAAGIGAPGPGEGFGGGLRQNRCWSQDLVSFRSTWVVMTHEIGHVLGGTHMDGGVGCVRDTMCGRTIMPPGGDDPAERQPMFSEANGQNMAAVLESVFR